MKEHNLACEDFIMDEIESIELVGEENTIDITVEDTHMFFANDVYSHNSGVNDEIISLDKISESYAKAMIADFIATCSRSLADKENGTGKIFIAKNRAGDDGVVFSMKVDLSKAKMEVVDQITAQQLTGQNTTPINGSTLKNLWSKHQNGSTPHTGT